jgi:CRISPR type I-E-associated protein CasA/Cse1
MNLVTDPWIPTTAGDKSLREVFAHAQGIPRLAHRNPLYVAASLRILLAIVYRAAGPFEQLDELPQTAIEHYLQQNWENLELANFLQCDLNDLPGEPKPWIVIAFDRASANTKAQWDHTPWHNPPSITQAEWARLLAAFQTFCVSAGVSMTGPTSGSPLGRQVVGWLEGANLEETLLLNLLPYSASEAARDRATWEQPRPTLDDLEHYRMREPLGRVERMTWLSRALEIVSDRYIRLTQGFKTQPAQRDLMATTHERPLLAHTGQPPTSPWWAAQLYDRGFPALSRARDGLTLRAVGLINDQANILGWVDSSLRLSPETPAWLAAFNAQYERLRTYAYKNGLHTKAAYELALRMDDLATDQFEAEADRLIEGMRLLIPSRQLVEERVW